MPLAQAARDVEVPLAVPSFQLPASERPNPPLALTDPGLHEALADLRSKRKAVGQLMKSAANDSMAAKAKARAEAKANLKLITLTHLDAPLHPDTVPS